MVNFAQNTYNFSISVEIFVLFSALLWFSTVIPSSFECEGVILIVLVKMFELKLQLEFCGIKTN